nr:MAG: hypothetical protein [Totiviridae sp.]
MVGVGCMASSPPSVCALFSRPIQHSSHPDGTTSYLSATSVRAFVTKLAPLVPRLLSPPMKTSTNLWPIPEMTCLHDNSIPHAHVRTWLSGCVASGMYWTTLRIQAGVPR